ncbi:RsmD family RNA methyltransferase [Deinococcus sp.]|uniref:RsmD family RNA methyltransferase n=1 Tax=Deinococcus sp. TaxID=47478 RepID=UPI0025B82F66|nr:RsmD family RNA methyltransferase [Deinococcus sp.]
MSLRILGGSARGRALEVPDSARPSGARIRKSLFDLLAARLPEGTFLDMHGGSGAIGLEAASRGYRVTLIEMDGRAVKALEANARALGLRARILKGDAQSLMPALGPFDIVFSDPPYDVDIPALTANLLSRNVVRPGGLLVCQHPDRTRLPDRAGYTRELREYGSNSLTIYERDEPDAEGQGGLHAATDAAEVG